jgi:hypothetical protein
MPLSSLGAVVAVIQFDEPVISNRVPSIMTGNLTLSGVSIARSLHVNGTRAQLGAKLASIAPVDRNRFPSLEWLNLSPTIWPRQPV